ncbi:MAG: hypothetical protein U0939_14910 [Pirellulales bacterium]
MNSIAAGRFLAALLIGLTVGAGANCAGAEDKTVEPLRVGLADVDITPPQGYPMAGYYHERLATGQRDPLKAKAVVFRSSSTSAAWVACDLIGVARDLCLAVRSEASKRTGIPAEQIVITGTHTHTAPDYIRELYDHVGGRPALPNRPAYAPTLIQRLVDVIVAAHEKAAPAALESGSATQATPVSFNRRFLMQDGSVKTWQRLDSPGVLRAAGPIDPQIGLVAVRSLDRRQTLGVLSNFALHLDTVGGQMWSGDYPHVIERGLRQKYGESLVSVFGTGTCGDINHSDPVAKERLKTEAIGESLTATILPALEQLAPIAAPALAVRSSVVKLPLQDATPAQLARATELLPAAAAGQKVDFFDQVSAYKAVVIDHFRRQPATVKSTDYIGWGLSNALGGVGLELPVEVTTIALGGDTAMVYLPGEVFVELGLAIKQASPFRTTLVVELANCVETIYVPTRAAYAQGSYEVTNSTVQPGSGEMLVEEAVRQLRSARE